MIEAVVSLSIVSLMMAALSSASIFLARSAPSASSASGVAAAMSGDVTRMQGELMLAHAVYWRDATEFAIEVADRDGDGDPESIRYYWEGAGTALQRSFNGAEGVSVTPTLSSFDVGYEAAPLTSTALDGLEPVVLQEFAENGVLQRGYLSGGDFVQPLDPELAADVEAWSLDVVRIGLERVAGDASTGEVLVEVFLDDGSGRPAGDALATSGVAPLDVPPQPSLVEFAFDEPPIFRADDDVVVKLSSSNDTTAALFGSMQPGDPQVRMFTMGTWLALPVVIRLDARGRTTTEPVATEGVTLVWIAGEAASVGPFRFGASPSAPAGLFE